MPAVTSQPQSFTAFGQPSTKLYCLVTEAYVCEQLAQSHYMKVKQPGIEPVTSQSLVRHHNHYN